jgi:hypothetical protein
LAELIFEPFAARLRWTLPQPENGDVWAAVVSTYLHALAGRCQEAGPCLIGHIKSFAPLPGGFLRVNTTRAGTPPDAEAKSSGPCAELTLTLNVLVYGLPAETLASLASGTATEVASARGGTVTLENPHQHHH